MNYYARDLLSLSRLNISIPCLTIRRHRRFYYADTMHFLEFCQRRAIYAKTMHFFGFLALRIP